MNPIVRLLTWMDNSMYGQAGQERAARKRKPRPIHRCAYLNLSWKQRQKMHEEVRAESTARAAAKAARLAEEAEIGPF